MTSKKIAIVGAGFTGLAAAWKLTNAGHKVTVFEKLDEPGGLASGFRQRGWDWTLEYHYHHNFASDKDILRWLRQMKLEKEMQFYAAQSASLINGHAYRLDSPLSLMLFPLLNFVDKLRMGLVLLGFKLMSNGQFLERWPLASSLERLMGKKGFNLVWQPILQGKFGTDLSHVNLAWFWARIKARTPKLGYPAGGYLHLARRVVTHLQSLGVDIRLSTPVTKLRYQQGQWQLTVKGISNHTEPFDQVLVASTASIFTKLCPNLPAKFQRQISQLSMLGAATLVLELSSPFFADDTYWLNVNESNWPMLGIFEHTNLVSTEHYAGHTLLYVGKYLKPTDAQFEYNKREFLDLYLPYLKKLNPQVEAKIISTWLFKEPAAQPLVGINHSQRVPGYQTPLPGLFWSSMQHVYPWDRGTNFAVRAGLEVAQLMQKHE